MSDEVIDRLRKTGVTGPHLHFEIWENGVPKDPLTIPDLQAELNLPVANYTLSEVAVTPDSAIKENADNSENKENTESSSSDNSSDNSQTQKNSNDEKENNNK